MEKPIPRPNGYRLGPHAAAIACRRRRGRAPCPVSAMIEVARSTLCASPNIRSGCCTFARAGPPHLYLAPQHTSTRSRCMYPLLSHLGGGRGGVSHRHRKEERAPDPCLGREREPTVIEKKRSTRWIRGPQACHR